MKPTLASLCLALLLATAHSGRCATIRFSEYDWTVRSGRGGPGPNIWEEPNVWVDPSGALHLKISQRDGKWSCAEITMQKRLGFGRYEFQVEGPIDGLDDNVVLGLFNYPTRDVGPGATHEIDIEFARWGEAKNPIGNYTVWPVAKALKQKSDSFPFTLDTETSTHRFTWSKRQIIFQSVHGAADKEGPEIRRWVFAPNDPGARISQQPMPVHINLWLFQGRPPKNGREVELVLRKFRFVPE